jgi:Tol biopolymer transport system component
MARAAWLVNADGHSSRRLTDADADRMMPSWSTNADLHTVDCW